MKIIRVAKAGKVLDQPHGPKPSGKLDSQIFLGKEDPSHTVRKKKKAPAEKSDSCTVCELKRR